MSRHIISDFKQHTESEPGIVRGERVAVARHEQQAPHTCRGQYDCVRQLDPMRS